LAREVGLGLWNQFVIPSGCLLHWSVIECVISAFCFPSFCFEIGISVCQHVSVSAFELVIAAFYFLLSAFTR